MGKSLKIVSPLHLAVIYFILSENQTLVLLGGEHKKPVIYEGNWLTRVAHNTVLNFRFG